MILLLVLKELLDFGIALKLKSPYFFVYAEDKTEGVLYNFNRETDVLEVIKSGLTPTGKSNGFDTTQGWSDLFFFTNGENMFTVEMNHTEDEGFTTSIEVKDMNLKDRDGRSVVGIQCNYI